MAILFAAVVGGQATDNSKLSAYIREIAQRKEAGGRRLESGDRRQPPRLLTAFVRIDPLKADDV